MASITRFDFSESLSCIISPNTLGTICQDRPYLSFSQPHTPLSPPSDSFSQNSSISFCVSQLTINEMASLNLKCGPPFSAINSCPAISNVEVMTDPLGLPETFAPASP